MISDLDVVRACRDAHSCMTPPSPVDALARRQGVSQSTAFDAIAQAISRDLVDDRGRPTEAGKRLLRESG